MQQRLISIFILIGCMAVFHITPSAQAGVTIQALLSHHTFSLDRAAQLTITLTGAPDSTTIELPKIKNIRFHRRGQSTQITMVNGSYSSSISRNYLVQALKPGKYTIPPITATSGNNKYTTQPISFTVTAVGGTTSKNNGNATGKDNRIAFLRITKTATHYTGEIVPITIKAYFSENYQFNQIELPLLKGDGVVMAQLPEEPEQTREQLAGRSYNVLKWHTTLSGIKIGRHPIIFTLNCTQLIAQQRRSLSPFRGRSLFDDPFFDNFLGGYQRKKITLTSKKTIFDVIPLPVEDQPLNFSGAIGDFTMQVKITPISVEVGEPLTLSIDISGQGNFDRVNAPTFPKNPYWKTYTPTSTFSRRGNTYSGTKSFEQAVVAKTERATTIPSLSFSYFDPRQHKYITVDSGEIPIHVQKSSRATVVQNTQVTTQKQPSSTSIANTSIEKKAEGLAALHLEIGPFYHEIVPLFQKSWFILLLSVCTAIFLVLIVITLQLKKLDNHPEIRLKKKVSTLLKNDLATVEKLKNSGDNLSFLLACRKTIQNQLGCKWDMAPSAISLEDIRARLHHNSPLLEIFAAADHGAYGGAKLTDKQVQVYCTTLRSELESLL